MLTPISDNDTAEETQSSAQTLAFVELADASRQADAKVLDDINPLCRIKTRLSVFVGDIELTVGELLAAREHQVLRLDRGIEQPVELLLDGGVVARGQLVAVDEQFAVRITELPVPLKV